MLLYFLRYIVQCPEENCNFRSVALVSHLIKFHKKSNQTAKQTVSEIISVFNHVTLVVKHGSSKPVLCLKCHRYVTRIDQHLRNIHKLEGDRLENALVRCKDESADGMMIIIMYLMKFSQPLN